MKRTPLLLAVAVPLGLAGCGGINQEAGAFLDGGTFGNATMHNHLVATCQATGSKYGSGSCAARTHDGQYMRTTYQEYVNSGREIPTIVNSFQGGSPGSANTGGS